MGRHEGRGGIRDTCQRKTGPDQDTVEPVQEQELDDGLLTQKNQNPQGQGHMPS